MGDDDILETRALTKDFRGFTAVSAVNLRVRRGTIHALIGPNGAGKTTVFNLLTKFLQPSSGAIFFKGEDVTRDRPADLARKGMVRSFQVSAVFPNLTVLENVRVALQRRLGTAFHFWKSDRSLAPLEPRARELLGEVDLSAFEGVTAGELPYGRKRALELATTIALEPELLLLDEPTQGMGHEDVGRVVDLIRRVARDRTVLMVEHNLSVVSNLCQRITVLQRGAVLAEGSYAEVSTDPRVLEAYIGAPEESS
jgi:branched-chain amino acid transport system ATP-binding protein